MAAKGEGKREGWTESLGLGDADSYIQIGWATRSSCETQGTTFKILGKLPGFTGWISTSRIYCVNQYLQDLLGESVPPGFTVWISTSRIYCVNQYLQDLLCESVPPGFTGWISTSRICCVNQYLQDLLGESVPPGFAGWISTTRSYGVK